MPHRIGLLQYKVDQLEYNMQRLTAENAVLLEKIDNLEKTLANILDFASNSSLLDEKTSTVDFKIKETFI